MNTLRKINIQKVMQMKRRIFLILVLAFYLQQTRQGCIHDHFAANATFHYYDDLTSYHNHSIQIKKNITTKQGRLLQVTDTTSSTTADMNYINGVGSIRIYADYSFIQTGGQTQKNQIKRVMNISANYFYNIMKVNRLQRLYYPTDSPLQCNILTVPSNYVTNGVIGDLGILVSNQVNTMQYIAKSTACALLKSNNRPIWGVMIWNNNFLQYDQVGFQKIVYVAIHQLTHILGFSAAMYSKYPTGNLYKNDSNGQYLTSPLIVQQLNNHFGCTNSPGMILQDQDGTLIPSHNERKVFGNQYMIASGKKGAYFSRATVALLASMGWYNVTFDYAEPTTWGKSKGCSFFQIDNCASQEFCSGSDFSCDWDVTAMGKCNIDPFAGSCKLTNYYTNTICIDESYQLKNLNAYLNAFQRGGYNSRCFSSNFTQIGLQPSALNNRCYITICSISSNYLYILVGQVVIVCTPSNMGKDMTAPGLDGAIRCPSSFTNYCNIKKTCTYGCNKNGACINGQCLCTGSLTLTSTCLDITLTTNQVDNTAGLLNSRVIDKGDKLELKNSKTKPANYNQQLEKITKAIQRNEKIQTKEVLTINTRAPKGTFFDPQFGQIVLCQKRFGCQQCTKAGCLTCPPGKNRFQGQCLGATRL